MPFKNIVSQSKQFNFIMKNFFFILSFLTITFSLQAQVLDRAFNGILSPIVETGSTANPDGTKNFDFQALFQNSQGQ